MGQRITKTRFNGGRVGPEFQWQSDLQLHASSCKEMLNWLPTLEGSTTRRPGAREILVEKNAIYENPTLFRHFPFAYGSDSTDIVTITLDFDVAIIRAYNSNASKVFESDYIPISEESFNLITVLQNFDAMYIFIPDAPTLVLKRFSSSDWKLEEHKYNGGPYGQENIDKTNIVSLDVPIWESGQSWDKGDMVVKATPETLGGTSSSVVISQEGNVRNYETVIQLDPPIATGKFNPGDKVYITGAVVGANKLLEGTYTVIRTYTSGGNDKYIMLDTGTIEVDFVIQNDCSDCDMSAASVYPLGQRQEFYISTIDGNISDPSLGVGWKFSEVLTGTYTLKSTGNTWKEGDVGRQIKITTNQVPRVCGKFDISDEGQASEAIPVFGNVSMRSNGIWDGELAFQLSLDGGRSYDDIGDISSSDGNYNGEISRTISDFGGLVRVYMRERNTATGDNGCYY